MISIMSVLQREDGPALPLGNVSEGAGRGIALVLVTGTETDAEVAHDLLTGGVRGEFLHCPE